MRLGLLARAENRGLGIQTWELYRHLEPARTVVIDMSDHNDYPLHLGRYPGAPVVRFVGDRLEPASVVDDLLDNIDVLLSAETPYEFPVLERARARGVRSAVVVNPEFYRYWVNPELARPDLIIVPTTWRIDEMPGAVCIPHGVDRQRLPFRPRLEARTFLHVAGHPAMGDRAGTQMVMRAAGMLRSDAHLVVKAQRDGPGLRGLRHASPRVEVIFDDVEDYWTLYDGADVLVAPRRYGGQSLPVNEAASCGMPAITLSRCPERDWGGVLTVPTYAERRLHAQSGPLESFAARPAELAKAIDLLATSPATVEQLSIDADARAAALSWEVVAPRYLEALAALG